MDTTTKKTAFGYLRVSDKSQLDGESLTSQKHKIEMYAERENIVILKWYKDEAKSGKNTDRPALQELLKDAVSRKKGSLDYLLVYKMNRASRDLISYVQGIKAVLAPYGIKVRSATEDFDDTPMGTFIENLNVMVGQLDNDNKRQTVVDNMTSIAKSGYWQHKPLLGYNKWTVKNSEGQNRPTMIPNETGKLVRDILLKWNTGEMTFASLTRYATSIGLVNPKGSPITQQNIQGIIERPEYAGYVHGKLTDYKLVKGQHEPLISEEIYWQNQELVKRKNKQHLLGLKHMTINEQVPLRRYVRCVNCKKPMTSSNPGGAQRYYCARPTCRKTGSITAKEAHQRFTELLQDVTPSDGTLNLMKEILIRTNRKERGNLDRSKRELYVKLEEISSQRTNTIEMYINQKLSEEEKHLMTRKLDEEQRSISEGLDELELRLTVSEAQIDYALSYMANIANKWQEASLEVRQKFQSLIFPKGFILDIKNEKFIIEEISPLYRYKTNKKELPTSENSSMVIPRRIELRLPG